MGKREGIGTRSSGLGPLEDPTESRACDMDHRRHNNRNVISLENEIGEHENMLPCATMTYLICEESNSLIFDH